MPLLYALPHQDIPVVINRHSRCSTGIVDIAQDSRHSTGKVMIARAFNVKPHCIHSMLKSTLRKLEINFF